EVLRVARANLQHDAGRIARRLEGRPDFVDMRFVRHLHRNHANAVLAGELEDIRQAFGAEALERIRVGPRLVRTHPRADLAVLLQRLHHRAGRLRRVDGAQAGEYVQAVLAEAHAVVLERCGAVVALLVPTQDAIGFRYADNLLHAGQHLHLLDRQRGGVADQVDLGQRHLGADFAMDAVLDPGKAVQLPRQGAVIGAFEAGIGFEDEDHGDRLGSVFS